MRGVQGGSKPRSEEIMSETYVLTREQLETVLRSTYAAGEQAGEIPLSAAGDERRFRRTIDAAVARAAEYTARKPTNETTPDAVEHRMTTDSLDGLEQLRRIIDEQPEPAPESVMLGLDYCYAEWVAERARHAEEVARLEERLAGSCEAEELRSGLEKLMADRGPLGTDAVSRDSLQALLDKVDARDSLLTLETIDSLRDQLHQATELVSVLEERLDAFEDTEPDARACAEWVIDITQYGDTRQAARRYLSGVANRTATRLHRDVETLRDQLRKVEGERDKEREHATEMEERALDLVRDLRLAQVELHALRSLLPDVRACAEWMRDELIEGHELQTLGCRILAAIDQKEPPRPMTDPTIPAEPEPCEYCGAKDWNITATLIGCHGCGVVYGRVNGAWALDPDTVPGSGRNYGLQGLDPHAC